MTTSASVRSTITVSGMTDTVGLAALSAGFTESLADLLTGCDAVFSADAELTAASVSYDLVGSLTDPIKETVTFASLLAVIIENTGDLPITIGGANNAPLLTGSTDQINLAAGKSLVLTGDITVTAGTGDLITINSLIAAWSAGTYAVGTIKRHNSILYQVIDEVETSLEPGVDTGWEDDWEVIDNESYKLIVLGIQPE